MLKRKFKLNALASKTKGQANACPLYFIQLLGQGRKEEVHLSFRLGNFQHKQCVLPKL
jgi:hypothetical protein